MIKFYAIEVAGQNLGVFYTASIPVSLLTKYSLNEQRQITSSGVGKNIQRELREKRVKDIAKYLQTDDSIIPNSIIVNFENNEDNNLFKVIRIEGNLLSFEVDESHSEKFIHLIDGQHRVEAYRILEESESLDEIQVTCSIFIDLPEPIQAYIFATVNFNQKPVDKSFALELFNSYFAYFQDSKSLSPFPLSVKIARNIAFDKPKNDDDRNELYKKIIIKEAIYDRDDEFRISLNTFSKGVCSLFSRNERTDNDDIVLFKKTRSELSDDQTPLRLFYKNNQDKVIYNIVKNYFNASAVKLLGNDKKYMFSNIGIGIQFGALRKILKEELSNGRKDFTIEFFKNKFPKNRILPDDIKPNSASKKEATSAFLKCLQVED